MFATTQNEGYASSASVAFLPGVFPSASLLLGVIVPVRNEAAHLVETLDALRNQTDLHGAPIGHDKYEILLLTNNCTDPSYRIARNYQQAWPELALRVAQVQLPAEEAHIGTARRILMDAAYERFMLLAKPHGIIASTDGDTKVDPTWVYQIIAETKKGADAVGGRIIVEPQLPGTYHTLDESYRMLIAKTESIIDPLAYDPWPRHYQYFGASLAVTCQMYDLAGRLPQLPYLEDKAFYEALVRRDAKIRRSTAVQVTTSGRRVGRVAIGLSEQLRKWARMEKQLEPQIVAPAAEIIFRATYRGLLRACWKEAAVGRSYAGVLQSAADWLPRGEVPWLQTTLTRSAFFGEFWEAAQQRLQASSFPAQWQPVDMTRAITDLTAFVNAHPL